MPGNASASSGLLTNRLIGKHLIQAQKKKIMSNVEAITIANNQFTVDLARQLNGDQNVGLSPLSTFLALVLICLGAEKTSEAQMKKVLHLENCKNIHDGIQRLKNTIQGYNEYKVLIEDMVFVEKTSTIYEDYISTSNAWYNTKPEKAEFRNAPRNAWEYINSWLKDKSEGTFQNIPEELVSNDTKLVVVNTAYLIANWTQRFPKYGTKDYMFTLSTGEKVPVQLMSTLGKFNLQIIDDEKLRILELPYGKTKDLCMYVILPDNNKDLDRVVQSMSYEKLTKWTDSKYMKKKHTKVFLPRLQIESAYSMKNILQSLGMPDVFNDTKAKLTGLSPDNLYVSDIISLATMNTDEDGTKDVSPATESYVFLAPVLPQVIFRTDHPFLYVIQHVPTKCYIFFGIFQKP